MPAHAQHAPDATDDSTGHATDHATDGSTDRTGCAPTFGCAVLGAAHNALGLCGERHRKDGKNASCHDQSGLHEQPPFYREMSWSILQ
jgi:hypothetical protein